MARDPETQDEDLAASLGALASSVRIALLRELRTPKTLSEIDLRVPPEPGAAPRPLARQTVREHLDRLLHVGAVVARDTERNRGPTQEYVLNHQALYAMAEEFRALASLRPTAEPHLATIERDDEPPRPLRLAGPCLVLAKGIGEGAIFPLQPPPQGRRQWVIGRSLGAQVPLDFDPFVSAENSIVEWENGLYMLRDLPDSRNGTLLNFERLAAGERRALATGDLVGMGRSLLLFRA